MISVIIPAYNEESTVASVVEFARKHKLVSEVIVVDDNSIDNTIENARYAGARIIPSPIRGKGASMKDGLREASNEIVAFLDADIDPYPEHTISLLCEPIIQENVDFVKATFSRNAGRVTELVAKPLLSIFFPELSAFTQPLSGMIAGKKEDLLHLDFPNDYGVDVSILIGMHVQKKIIRQVGIGYIGNNSKSWRALSKMSLEVAQAIIKKALIENDSVTVSELCGFNLIQTQLESAYKENLRGLKKMIIFDMDDTLLNERFIDKFTAKYDLKEKLEAIRNRFAGDPMSITKRIAGLMKGYHQDDVLGIVRNIAISENAKEVIHQYKAKGFITGIISDSYRVVTDYVKEKLGLDFALANELEFVAGKATGEVRIPSFFFKHSNSCCDHTLCKSHAMAHIAEAYGIDIENCITVGDSLNDLCMIEKAGIGVAYCPLYEIMSLRADRVISTRSMSSLLDFTT